jgi:hypothetical protein
MKKLVLGSIVFGLAMMLAYGTVFAGKDLNGNGFPSGRHFNLNIIGVPHDKDVPDMKGSNRHTIFVPLESGEDVGRKVKIKYVVDPADPDNFRVVDGNATDDNEAIIQVPYEYCLDYDAGCYEMLSYDVYARALGKPGPFVGAIVTAECEYMLDVVDPDGSEDLTCEDTLLMGSFDVRRPGKKPITENITEIFRATGCLDMSDPLLDPEGVGICEEGDLEFRDLWIFNIEELDSYMWDYDNNGLKLLQVRFYETVSGYIGYVQ